jgi:hypothetical protein
MTHRFLPTPLRKALEKDIKKAREIAEEGATAAIARLGVAEATAPAHLSEHDKAARRRLRAYARALGDAKVADGGHTVDLLIEAAAYAQWHRRLFARFLAERDLLRHPVHGVAVTLEDAEELAGEEGYADGWSAAEAYAAKMLPAVFQPDDPVLALTLAPEHEQALRKLVLGLNAETFQTDDALGWTYQFWRALEKDRVNKAGGKIGARELPAVTQLFTEPYMVQFLLHNTLGAWRAGKILAARPELAAEAADETELRAAVSPAGYAFDMLRFVREGEDGPWRSAAGAFSGWPKTSAEIRALDPCCGSGHFLTEMLAILAALRADEESLADAEAVAAVLRDNLFGLELDGRCVQIAAFAVALTAWRIGGFQPFGPEQVHIAWVGAPPPLERSEFLALANGDGELREGLAGLHQVFSQAPLLGSLIEPKGGDLMSPQRLGRMEPLLDRLVEKTRAAEPERAEGAVAARGMADAAAILSNQYTLVATNVPFLGRGKQDATLSAYIERTDSDAKADLATAMLSRTLRMLKSGGTTAAVTPQNWTFLAGSALYRAKLLDSKTLDFFVTLGEEAWEEFGDRGPLATLLAFTSVSPEKEAVHFTSNALPIPQRAKKIEHIRNGPLRMTKQNDQRCSPDARIVADEPVTGDLLSRYATAYQGIATGDYDRFGRLFWEIALPSSNWEFQSSTVDATRDFGGLEHVLYWEGGNGALATSPQARIQGIPAVGRQGISITQMRTLAVSRFMGSRFDNNCAAMTVADDAHLPAVWTFCSSTEYQVSVRRIDPKVSVTNATLTKVPFDLAHWTAKAAERYPSGLPEPYSDDPTQWLFHGHPAKTELGTHLHVALARLAGYRWPAESDSDMRLSVEAKAWIAKTATLPEADADGVLPLLAVAGERPLADRLRDYLNAVTPGWDEANLVREADERIDKKAGRDLSLEAWLGDRAFRQHCALFHNRPFLWHVSDGQKDGFSAFLHYHRLDHATLQKLTYTLLGAWIARREAEKDERRVEAAKILQKRLEAILVGDAPYDIFVRWKSLAQQPLGWIPDLDDGVRLNIRPWVEAGILRESSPKGIKWGVDRGTDVASAAWFKLDQGKRNNDHHPTLAEKRNAREAATRKVGAA